jgi:hypothetical protein
MEFPDDVSALRRNDSVESQQVRMIDRRVERAQLNALERSRFEGVRRRFQSWVLEEMNWFSNGGFELIPVDEAYTYLQGKEYAFVGNGERVNLDDIEPAGRGQPWVVLFQSSNYDIVLLPSSIPDEIPALGWSYGFSDGITADLYVFDRAFRMPRIAEPLGRFFHLSSGDEHKLQFVEVDGEPPQEVMQVSIQRTQGSWSARYSILTFEAGHLRQLYEYNRSRPHTGVHLERHRLTEPGRFGNHPVPFDESDIGEDNRIHSFSFREQAVVEAGTRFSVHPEEPREAPIERHECRFAAEAGRFTCDETLEKRVTLESVDGLVPDANDVSEAEVLRFVLENRQELRESGYVIPQRLVEEVEGRLDGMEGETGDGS